MTEQTAKKQSDKVDNLVALSELMNRMKWASKLGQSYGGDRDLYKALGYKQNLTYNDYLSKWKRHDIAKAIINRPIKGTWKGGVQLLETEEDEDTILEKDFKDLYKRLKLRFKFSRLDKLCALGEYALLLLGLDDVKDEQDFANPVQTGNRKLLYVRPFGQGSTEIKSYVTDPTDERYGLPYQYEVEITQPGTKTIKQILVHHSRIIHVANDLLESELLGSPELQSIFNRLEDLERIVGGSGEMFWRGARPGYKGKVDKDYSMTAEAENNFQDQLDEYEHNLRRFLMTEGIDVEALTSQVHSPKEHVDVQLDMICAIKGIPKRILVGNERGELASTEDKSQWNDLITSRRTEYAEPVILLPFVETGIKCGFLSTPKQENEYSFVWEDLYAPSEKEKADVGKIRSDALAAYTKQPAAQEIVPPEAFYEIFLGLNEDQKDQIRAIIEEQMKQEQSEIQEQEEEVEEE